MSNFEKFEVKYNNFYPYLPKRLYIGKNTLLRKNFLTFLQILWYNVNIEKESEGKKMFEVGEYIIYSHTGVCKVEEILVPEGSIYEDKLYYKLCPVFKPETVFIPVDSPVFMRRVLTKEEALRFIDSIPGIEDDKEAKGLDPKSLNQHYKAFLNSHESTNLVQLIKTIHLKEKELTQRGKKLIKADSDCRQKAKDILHGELSISLGIPVDEVENFISQRIGAEFGI